LIENANLVENRRTPDCFWWDSEQTKKLEGEEKEEFEELGNGILDFVEDTAGFNDLGVTNWDGLSRSFQCFDKKRHPPKLFHWQKERQFMFAVTGPRVPYPT
jgi:hypothetical protein